LRMGVFRRLLSRKKFVVQNWQQTR
jgi:hypothetical protein